ncbi:MAG: hypothetical protein UT38_C0019G0002 [Microgenomates group bacterium GW2011_GWA2_39_19]|nr:MAG: hypothetical protein UT38_C0019G0002 [Microgenomates group bacterium GW2011_GWA2_39_19]
MKLLKVTKHQGYSLVEIMIVIIIMSFLFVGGFTQYRDFSRRQMLSNTADELRSNLNLARQLALSGEKEGVCPLLETLLAYKVTFTSTSYSITAVCSTTSPSARTVINLAETVRFTTNPTEIKYNVLGKGVSITGSSSIILNQTSTGNNFTLTVNTQGVVQ